MARTDIPVKRDPDSGIAPFYSYTNITGQVSTPIKVGGGFLHTITFNKPTATTVAQICDVTTAFATTTIGTITVPASPMPVTLTYDVEFASGLSIVTTTANSDITVSYL